MDHQLGLGAKRQTHFGGDMTKRQIGQHRHLQLLAQPVDHRVELKARIVAGERVVGKSAKHNGLLTGQNTGMQPLRQHAFNAVRVLGQVFQVQNTATNIWEIWGSDQAGQNR